jgi:hypothetical protein
VFWGNKFFTFFFFFSSEGSDPLILTQYVQVQLSEDEAESAVKAIKNEDEGLAKTLGAFELHRHESPSSRKPLLRETREAVSPGHSGKRFSAPAVSVGSKSNSMDSTSSLAELESFKINGKNFNKSLSANAPASTPPVSPSQVLRRYSSSAKVLKPSDLRSEGDSSDSLISNESSNVERINLPRSLSRSGSDIGFQHLRSAEQKEDSKFTDKELQELNNQVKLYIFLLCS